MKLLKDTGITSFEVDTQYYLIDELIQLSKWYGLYIIDSQQRRLNLCEFDDKEYLKYLKDKVVVRLSVLNVVEIGIRYHCQYNCYVNVAVTNYKDEIIIKL